jgi:acyl-CoA synthetase (NDP forming)
MARLDALLNPQVAAVVGASDDGASYGGRVWRFLRRDFGGLALAVNRRSGAVKDAPCVASLTDLDVVPDVVVLATPSRVVAGLLREASDFGVRAVVVLARDALGQEIDLRAIADEGGVALLGPNCLGLIHANVRTALSSSISLERPLRPGPFALVSQSGALMGVLHARATDLGLGLGLCISTGSQAQLGVEDFLSEIAGMEALQVVAVYMEDIDVPRFEAAATALRLAGKRLAVLKSGDSATGRKATQAHTQSLASDGRMFRLLAADLGAVAVSDPNELLAALPALKVPGPRIFLVTVSGGLGAIAADRAEDLGLELSQPLATVERRARQNGQPENGRARAITALSPTGAPPIGTRPNAAAHEIGGVAVMHPALSNPLDLEAADGSMGEKAATIRALVEDGSADVVLFLVTDMPGMEELLEAVGPVWDKASGRLIVASECSLQAAKAWSSWVEAGRHHIDDWNGLLRALAGGHPARRDRSATVPPAADLSGVADTLRLVERAGIDVAACRLATSRAEAVQAAGELGYPVALKVAESSHRGAGGVRVCLTSEHGVTEAYEELKTFGAVLVQAQVGDGLEFYVGVKADARFGLMLIVGQGGPDVEERSDVAVARCPVSRETISSLIAQTGAGRWLSTPVSRGLVDLESLAGVAHRATIAAAQAGSGFSTLDLNPVVVGPRGALVVDAKMAFHPEKMAVERVIVEASTSGSSTS